MLSSASEKIADEPVKKYAMNLIVSSATPTTSDSVAATASLRGTRPSQAIMPYPNAQATEATLAHQLRLRRRLAPGESEILARRIDIHMDRVAFSKFAGENFGGHRIFQSLL